MNLNKQLRRLSAFGCLSCMRVTDPIWVVFLISRGYSLWQVGLAEGIFHAVSLLCEIPSGIAADLLGRRRTLAISGLCGLCSAVIMLLAQSYLDICIAMIFSALSCSLISGSDEALLYDSLLQARQADRYLSVSAAYTRLQTAGRLLGSAATLLVSRIGYGGLYLLDTALCLLRSGAALTLSEPTVTEAQARRTRHPFRDLPQRLRRHVTIAISFLRSHPDAAKLMLMDGLIALPSYLTLMFLQQRLTELGLPAVWLGLPVILISLAEIAGLSTGERIHIPNMNRLYALSSLAVGAGTIAAGLCSMLPALFGAAVAAVAMNIWMLHLQNHLNKLYPSDQRATLVSVNMMAYSLLMIAASPAVGWLSDLCGTAGAGLTALGVTILLSILII